MGIKLLEFLAFIAGKQRRPKSFHQTAAAKSRLTFKQKLRGQNLSREANPQNLSRARGWAGKKTTLWGWVCLLLIDEVPWAVTERGVF